MDASNTIAAEPPTRRSGRVRRGRRIADRTLRIACPPRPWSGALVLGSILLMLIVEGVRGFTPTLFTNPTPGPGSEGGGIANAILGQPRADRHRHRDRHAGRRHGRDLPGRVRTRLEAGGADPLPQRHPALGALDPDRPVRLHADGAADGDLFGLGRRRGARDHRRAGDRAHHRGHAAPRPRHPAGGRRGPRRAALEGDRQRDVAGGVGRHRHRHHPGAGPHRRRDRAAPVHRAQQQFLVLAPT